MYCALLWRDSMVSWGWHRAVKFWQNEKPPGRFFSVILSHISILYMDQARVSWAYAANKRVIVLREGCDFWPHQVEQLTQSYIIHCVLLYWSQISGTVSYSHLCFNHFYLYWPLKIRTIGAHLSKVFAFFLAFPCDSKFVFDCVYNPAILW